MKVAKIEFIVGLKLRKYTFAKKEVIMPRCDGTGRMGNGSTMGMGNRNRQGRRIGNCGRNAISLGFRQGQNSDLNLSVSSINGRQVKGFNNITFLSTEDELTFLKNRANNMESNLNKINTRISELEKS